MRTGLAALCVALIAVATAAAATKPEPGKFAGSAGAGFPIHFSVSADGKTVDGLRTDFEGTVNCGPPSDDPPYFTFGNMTISNDSFHGATVENASSGIAPSYTIKGTFASATKVTGTIHVSFSYPHNALPPCNETDDFTAKRT